MKFLDKLCSEDDEIVDKVMHNEYWYFQIFSGLYPKMNTPKWRVFSVIQFIIYMSFFLYHAVLLIITAIKLTDDKVEMFQSLHYLTVLSISIYVTLFLQMYRQTYAKIHRAIGTRLFSYDEKTDEFKKTLVTKMEKKKKVLVQLIFSYYSTIPFIMLILEKSLNAYSGDDKVVLLSPNLPVTIWIPYETDSLIGSSSALIMIAVVCGIVVMVFATADVSVFVMCENLAMELRFLIHSLNRLPERTLHLYRLRHGDNTNVSIETIKENTDLSNCCRDCLKQNIIHHQNINE
ncbi:hypothetical protein O3M35_009069 [Rhynocoris fuscipes]|uniref:Odorant receptor n=1 Tax=Rhynocoris fuscipes TaxID=488301 RepID=A0AAW1D1J7_9HEMI